MVLSLQDQYRGGTNRMTIFGNNNLEFVPAVALASIYELPVSRGLKVARPRWTDAGFETPSEGVGPED